MDDETKKYNGEHCGLLLRQLRKEAGLTQKELSAAAGYEGVTGNYVSMIETGYRTMGYEAALHFGEVLGVDPYYLLGVAKYKNSKDEFNEMRRRIAEARERLDQLRLLYESILKIIGFTIVQTKDRTGVYYEIGKDDISLFRFNEDQYKQFITFLKVQLEKTVFGLKEMEGLHRDLFEYDIED